jgi:tetratricopeptide (TPR) repeat protein
MEGEADGTDDGAAADDSAAELAQASVLVNGAVPETVERPAPGADLDLFHRRLRPVVRDDAAMNLEMGRLERAEASLAKALDWLPEDPESQLILARLRLAEAEKDAASAPQLTAEARAALLEAIRLDADRPEPHLELALLHYRAGELADACREFGFYLDLAPDGEESPRVRDYLLELRGDGACR